MLSEAPFEVCGHSHVAFTPYRKTLNKVHVIQWPSFAKASKGILLRARIHGQSCEAYQREAG
jgi:hypothetical protein